MTVSKIRNYVAGRLVQPTSGRSQPVFNPSTGKITGEVTLSTAIEVADAVAAAKAAFPAWADTPAIKRARLMNRLLYLMNARKDDLATAITAEHGKIIADAQLNKLISC